MFSTLHLAGCLSVSYIDDCYLQGDTPQDCIQNVETTVDMFKKLGFIVHPEKSVLEPSHELKFQIYF